MQQISTVKMKCIVSNVANSKYKLPLRPHQKDRVTYRTIFCQCLITFQLLAERPRHLLSLKEENCKYVNTTYVTCRFAIPPHLLCFNSHVYHLTPSPTLLFSPSTHIPHRYADWVHEGAKNVLQWLEYVCSAHELQSECLSHK